MDTAAEWEPPTWGRLSTIDWVRVGIIAFVRWNMELACWQKEIDMKGVAKLEKDALRWGFPQAFPARGWRAAAQAWTVRGNAPARLAGRSRGMTDGGSPLGEARHRAAQFRGLALVLRAICVPPKRGRTPPPAVSQNPPSRGNRQNRGPPKQIEREWLVNPRAPLFLGSRGAASEDEQAIVGIAQRERRLRRVDARFGEGRPNWVLLDCLDGVWCLA